MLAKDPTRRFSSRVADYARSRPGYPAEVIELLHSECGLTPDSVVADLASGTGIFARMLLENGTRVFGVEPNPEMRRAGEEFLAEYPRFISVAGTAESSTLPERSVDIITAAQAAHWFDPLKARREFVRVLKPGGWLVLLWNERRAGATPLMRAYEQLLQTYSIDYHEVRHEYAASSVESFFAPSPFHARVFATQQVYDYPALEARLLSSSYTPEAGHPNYQPMLQELRRIFEAYRIDNRVVFEYNTRVYYGRIG